MAAPSIDPEDIEKIEEKTPSFRERLDSLMEKYKGEPEMLQEVQRVRSRLARDRLAMSRRASARRKRNKQAKLSRRANRG